jgi:hypothetical protein
MRKVIAAGVGAAGALVWVISCVSNQGIEAGTQGGACLPNGTCFAPLVCIQNGLDHGTCSAPDADASSDGGPKGDGNPQGDGTIDSPADAPIICDPNVDASDLPPYCTLPGYKLCFPKGDAAPGCIAGNAACNGGNGVAATCLGDTKDGSTCCIFDPLLGDAGCATSIDPVDGSGFYSSPGNCIFATSEPAIMLCTSTATCAKYIDASSVCAPAVFTGTGTSMDTLYTGVCK